MASATSPPVAIDEPGASRDAAMGARGPVAESHQSLGGQQTARPIVFAFLLITLVAVPLGYYVHQRRNSAVEATYTLQGHNNNVTMVAFSPDGASLASAGFDGTTRLWDVSTGKQKAVLQVSGNGVDAIKFSPDGQYIAAGGGYGEVRLWDVATGQLRRAWQGDGGNTASVITVAFSPDSRRVLAVGRDGLARTWDVVTGELAKTFAVHADGVGVVLFSPDAAFLAVGTGHVARLWDMSTGELKREIPITPGDPEALAFSPNGLTLAIGSAVPRFQGDAATALWDVEPGALKGRLPGKSGESTLYALVFSPDGHYLAVATGNLDNTVSLWDTQTGQIVHLFHGGPQALAISPDGTRLVSAGNSSLKWGDKMWMYDLASGKQRGSFRANGPAAFSPDGRWLATGDGFAVQLWQSRALDQPSAEGAAH